MICDLAIAAENARLSEPEIRYYALSPLPLLPFFTHSKALHEFYYTGDMCAVVILRDDDTITLDELRACCEGRIARYQVPRRLILSRTPLPCNATGKLLKSEIRRQLAEGPAVGAGAET